MLNAFDAVRADPRARCFEVGELLFAQFTCPTQDEPLGIWSHTDWLVHVVSARATWRTSQGTLTAEAGETAFFRKGAYISPPHVETDLCLIIFAISDAIVRETVREFAAELPPMPEPYDLPELALRVNHDTALSAFLQSMAVYFASDEAPPTLLLRLKLKELLTSILVSTANPALSAYFRSVALRDAPPIPAIMEANFHHNLPLVDFAKLCHRSLSSFKREFRQHYNTTPGKWLLERRLECASRMLSTTSMSVTEVAFECGFEDASHFCRAFKDKFGQPPSVFRGVAAALV